MEGLLKHRFGLCGVSLPLCDEAEIKQACAVMRIELEAFLKISFCLVESAEMPVRDAKEHVRPCGWIQCNQFLECFDGLVHLACHEIAFAQRGQHIGALW